MLDNITQSDVKPEDYLVFLGDRIANISKRKMGISSFSIDFQATPLKILYRSLDEMELREREDSYNFISCLNIRNNNYALLYERSAHENFKTNEEIDYLLTVSETLTIQQKLNEIFSFETS